MFAEKEKQDGCTCVVEVDGPQTTIRNPNGEKTTTFTYDHSYFQDAKSVRTGLARAREYSEEGLIFFFFFLRALSTVTWVSLYWKKH